MSTVKRTIAGLLAAAALAVAAVSTGAAVSGHATHEAPAAVDLAARQVAADPGDGTSPFGGQWHPSLYSRSWA